MDDFKEAANFEEVHVKFSDVISLWITNYNKQLSLFVYIACEVNKKHRWDHVIYIRCYFPTKL